MFIDSDVELRSDCIMRLRAEMNEYGWAGIHAKVLSRENLTRWQRAEDEFYSIFYAPGPHRDIPTMGALYRRDILLRFPFDPAFREASEDLDLCHRLKQNNHQVGVSNTAIAYHRHRREFTEFARQRFVYGLGDARFALKYKELRMLADLTLLWLPVTAKRIMRKRIRLLPCWLVGRLIQFLGFVVGLRNGRSTATSPSK
jgi:GT2 family glycosyltransferase